MTDDNGVGVKLPQDKKWNQVKTLLAQLYEDLAKSSMLDRKKLKSIRGSLVYVQQTYPAITPYLKGLHLTIDSWRPNRD